MRHYNEFKWFYQFRLTFRMVILLDAPYMTGYFINCFFFEATSRNCECKAKFPNKNSTNIYLYIISKYTTWHICSTVNFPLNCFDYHFTTTTHLHTCTTYVNRLFPKFHATTFTIALYYNVYIRLNLITGS